MSAFRRSVIKLADRADVHPALKKLWKKHYAIDGQVTRHLSPMEQKIVSPMFKDAHTKIFKKIFDFAIEAGPGLITGIVVFKWSNDKFEELAHAHRP